MKITFWGATEEVTGSMTFLEVPEGLIMVDCGMSQGQRESEDKNLEKLPFKASQIHAIILTHAHLDHSGLLPRLVKEGFRGRIFSTIATSRLAKIILEDSASLSREGLYDEKDVSETLKRFKTNEFNEHFKVAGVDVSFLPAGHILGAASVKIKIQDKVIVFSGDLGRKDDPLMNPPEPCPKADIVIMESTYGSRIRNGNLRQELNDFLMKVSREKRIGIVASFAVARAQNLIQLIHDFFERYPDEKFRVVLDSPMMIEANLVYKSYAHQTHEPNDLPESLTDFEVIAFERQWKSLSHKEGPLLILSSSGMLSGGRIKRHLINWQNDSRAMLFLPGYQAKGTPGRLLLEGERSLSFGEESVYWKGEVIGSEAFSSHADQGELVDWLKSVEEDARIFLIHGEEESKKDLEKKLRSNGFKEISAPGHGEVVEI